MENNTSELDNIDEAAKAFGKLRREVTTMRLAIEQLVDEPNRIEIPDYTVTLVEFATSMNSISEGLEDLSKVPVLKLTPTELAGQIASAGIEARKVEQTALTDATNNLGMYAREMASFVASARTEQKQTKWLVWTGTIGTLFGAVLMILIYRLVGR